METVQIVLDKQLLQATDQAAKKAKQNRSALVRIALREHLRKLELQAMDRRDREGYRQISQSKDDSIWDSVAAWPEE